MFAESVHCQLGVAKGNRKVIQRTRTIELIMSHHLYCPLLQARRSPLIGLVGPSAIVSFTAEEETASHA